MHFSQRAVWRNGGSNPAESDMRTRTVVARLTCSVSRRCAKPPGRYVLSGDSAVLKTTCENSMDTTEVCASLNEG